MLLRIIDQEALSRTRMCRGCRFLTHGIKYHNLQKMASDILVIPVSTIASKFTFSNSESLVSFYRSRFHLAILETLIYARHWLLNEVKSTF